MSKPKSDNLTWDHSLVRREQREQLLKQKGCIFWFTGLSGAGKSTVSRALEQYLVQNGRFAYVLDGDNVRHHLNKDLGFSDEDRTENIRRCAEVANLFADAGAIAITAFISPFAKDRAAARELAGEHPFIEVYVSTPLAVCEERDPKGLYKKVRAGEIKNFTGIDSAYEAPTKPDIALDTSQLSVEDCVQKIVDYIHDHNFIHGLNK